MRAGESLLKKPLRRLPEVVWSVGGKHKDGQSGVKIDKTFRSRAAKWEVSRVTPRVLAGTAMVVWTWCRLQKWGFLEEEMLDEGSWK